MSYALRSQNPAFCQPGSLAFREVNSDAYTSFILQAIVRRAFQVIRKCVYNTCLLKTWLHMPFQWTFLPEWAFRYKQGRQRHIFGLRFHTYITISQFWNADTLTLDLQYAMNALMSTLLYAMPSREATISWALHFACFHWRQYQRHRQIFSEFLRSARIADGYFLFALFAFPECAFIWRHLNVVIMWFVHLQASSINIEYSLLLTTIVNFHS